MHRIVPIVRPLRVASLDPEQRQFVEETLASLENKRDALLSEDDALYRRSLRANKPIFLTGDPGSGKSVCCEELVKNLQEQGFQVLRALPTGALAVKARKIPGLSSQTFHTPFGVNVRSILDTARLLRHYDLWVIGEIGMLRQALFRHMYGVYAELQYAPTVVLEGDFGQLPPLTPSPDDARSCSLWSRHVRTVELRRQHRSADDALKAFASSIRASRPSQQAVDAFFAQLKLTDQVDEESVMAARAFVGDGCIITANQKVMSLVNTMIIQTLSEAETKMVPVWEDDAVESLDLKVGCSVRLTRNVDLGKNKCNAAVAQFLSLTPSGLRLRLEHGREFIPQSPSRSPYKQHRTCVLRLCQRCNWCTPLLCRKWIMLPRCVLFFETFAPPAWEYTAVTPVKS